MGTLRVHSDGILMLACGLDFGTSNSAIGVVRDGAPVLVPVEGDARQIPSAVFFDYERRGRILFGANAIDATIAGTEGRLMRALKTILGSPLIDEKTVLGKERIALAQVVEIFIRHLKAKAETFQQGEIPVGGTDFDTALNLDTVMPLLGRGTRLIQKNLPMPNAIYRELSTWATINFTYTQENERRLRAMVADAREPKRVLRLLRTIRDRLGHRIAFAVEDAKIALSDAQAVAIRLDFIEDGLASEARRQAFDSVIEAKTAQLYRTAARCIADAGLEPDTIRTAFFTGGSSRVLAVREAIARAAPEAQIAAGSDLLSVASGLTRQAARFG